MSNEAPAPLPHKPSVADKLRRVGREVVDKITGRNLLRKAEEERKKAHED
jgi:hypothetical protein